MEPLGAPLQVIPFAKVYRPRACSVRTRCVVNYLDRTVGIAATSLTKDLGLSAAVMCIGFSAFSWTYTVSQIPAG